MVYYLLGIIGSLQSACNLYQARFIAPVMRVFEMIQCQFDNLMAEKTGRFLTSQDMILHCTLGCIVLQKLACIVEYV